MGFAPIRISVLRGDQKIGFDCYIEVAGKQLLYLRKGDSFEGARLAKLKEKKVKKMLIREEDEQLYRDYMARNIDMAYDKNSSQSLENRANIVQGLQQSNTEAVFENPADEVAYAAAKEGSQRFTDFLMAEDKAIKNLLALENADQSLSHHGVTVASLAVRIAKETGYDSPKNLPLLAMGGLIHDLGHYISGQNITRPIKDFSPQELELYKQHPAEGAKKFKDLKHMDQHVVQIILEHEENINGSGFPDKKVEAKLNPLSVYVGSANLFDRLVTFERVPRADVVKRLFSSEYLGRYPLSHFNAIKTILQGN